MNPRERVAHFLHKVASQERLTVNVRTPAEKSSVTRKFISALKVMAPAMALSAAAHAGQPAPEVVLQVNGGAPVTVQSVQDLIEKVNSYSPSAIDQMGAIARCMHKHLPRGAGVSDAMVLATMNASANVSIDIEDWAARTGNEPMLGVAAFCENPSNWQAQAQEWIAQTAKYDNLVGSIVRQHLAERALAGVVARAQTVQQSVNDAAYAQRMADSGEFYGGGHAVKVRGAMDWVSAASSIAEGAAHLFGGKEAVEVVRGADRTLRDGTNVVRRGESVANRRDSASRARGVGEIMESVGRRYGASSNRYSTRNRY